MWWIIISGIMITIALAHFFIARFFWKYSKGDKWLRYADEWIEKADHYPIYLAQNFPPFGAGWFCGLRGCFIQASTNFNYTLVTIKHEYEHYNQRKRKGWLKFWFWAIPNYLELWVPHDKKSIEHGPEDAEGKG